MTHFHIVRAQTSDEAQQGPDPATALTICPTCGEIFDASKPEEAEHHATPDHAPLLRG